MVRTLLFALVIIVLVLLVVLFSWRNPGSMEVDLIFRSFEVSKALAFAATIAIGWSWGLLSALAYIVKLLNERRRLNKRVRLADAELSNLRNLPMQDAG